MRSLPLLAIVVAVSACGGDDEAGATTSTSTSSASGAGGTGAGGAGTGGATQSSAASGGSSATYCNECVDGPWKGCGGEACKQDDDCTAWTMCYIECVQSDYTSSCFQACADAHPSSAAIHEMLVECVCTQCSMWCLPLCS